MAGDPPFFVADDDPLDGFFPAVRSFHFAHAVAFQAPYFRAKFPPRAGSKATAGWNRHCNLATRCRLQKHVESGDIVELVGFDHSEIPPRYEGIWFDSGQHPFAVTQLATALILDLKRRRKVEDGQRVFYATQACAALVHDSLGENGRSEFVDAQFTLESFRLLLLQAEDERSRRMADSWKSLSLPDNYDTYRSNYRGDAIVRDNGDEIVVCSPAIYGWWKTAPVHEFLRSLPSRVGNKRFILLSPLGFRRWLRLHKEAPWHAATTT